VQRLIIVPQYPARLRYAEWWFEHLQAYHEFFDVCWLGALDRHDRHNTQAPPLGHFAPNAAIDFELMQMQQYAELNVDPESDILLLCDLSYPGMFASMLFHKRPKRCYAVCHATSLNRYDIFASDRNAKWKVEKGMAKLFDTVFVSSEYHKRKLGWHNTEVVRFPLPDIDTLVNGNRLSAAQSHIRPYVSVARKGVQKIDRKLEEAFEQRTGCKIRRFYKTNGKTWADYYGFVQSGKFLIVTSREETYGYQVIDALSVDTMPIAPKERSYLEILPPWHLYKPGDVDSMLETIEQLSTEPSLPELWSDDFIGQTAGIMRG
jgi:hypothetical protein